MWIYREDNLKSEFQVGYLETRTDETGSYTEFQTIEIHPDKDEARKAVNYLNGGNPKIEVSGIVYNQA